MQFERGKDPKDALGIGERANAKEIIGVAEIRVVRDPFREWDYKGSPIVRWDKRYERVEGGSHVNRILMGIEAMELNPEEYAIMYWPEEAEEDPIGVTMCEKYIDMVDLLGKYVKYKDYLYRIPTYEEFRKKYEASNRDHENWPIRFGH